MSFHSRIIIAVFIILIAIPAFAQIKVEVTDGSISQYNMAVAAVSAKEQADAVLANEITEAMKMTLDITGYFKILDP
ncbi:MAG TPA: hypothetical protein P5044_04735, partial [bacterium]|nr:hypothetical protein [bacterium]